MVNSLFNDWFPVWLSALRDLVIYRTKQEDDKNSNEVSMIRMITAGIKNSDANTEVFLGLRLHEDISAIFLVSTASMDRYLPLLDLISELAKMSN